MRSHVFDRRAWYLPRSAGDCSSLTGQALVHDGDPDLAAYAVARALQLGMGVGDAGEWKDGSDMGLQLPTGNEGRKLVKLPRF